jgi:hypothetical protein
METRRLRETHRRRIKTTEIMLSLTAAAGLRPPDKIRNTGIRTQLKVLKKLMRRRENRERQRIERERENETHVGLQRGWRTIECKRLVRMNKHCGRHSRKRQR